MVRPLAPFALKGFVWYQGESNCIANENITYPFKLQLMVNAWRKVWEKDNLPLYTVLIGPYKYTNWTGARQTPQNLPLFWQAQQQILKMPNMEIICICDLVDNLKDSHPSYKWEVGRRLSLVAINKTYGDNGIEYSGPRFSRLEIKNNEAIVYFNHADGRRTSDASSPNYFSVAGADNIYYRASAKIADGKVILSSSNVSNPVNVQFGWDETAQPNLVNSANLPAFPFVDSK